MTAPIVESPTPMTDRQAQAWLDATIEGLDALGDLAAELVGAYAPGDVRRQPLLDILLGRRLVVGALLAMANGGQGD